MGRISSTIREFVSYPGVQKTIGAEVISQLADSAVVIDQLVAVIGSGGSVRTIGELLRERHNQKLKTWTIVPAVYPSDIKELNPGHLRKQGHWVKIFKKNSQLGATPWC